MKILALGTSNNRDSINRRLAVYAAKLIDGASVSAPNIADFELPLFSNEREEELGKPELAQAFLAEIAAADGLVVSFAEHNSSYTAAFKNLFDWVSRIDKSVYQNKPAVFLATSPGGRGAQTVLGTAVAAAPHYGAELVAYLSVPRFAENFDPGSQKITNPAIAAQIAEAMKALASVISGAR